MSETKLSVEIIRIHGKEHTRVCTLNELNIVNFINIRQN
jgi:hypothetical protein